MNKTNSSEKPKTSGSSKSGSPAKKHASASEQATKTAQKGEPIPAQNPRDRSPKQENL